MLVHRFPNRRLVRLAAAILLTLPIALAVAAQNAQEVEIRDYEGEKLGSVTEFPENSIHGVQEIDLAAYRLVVDGLVTSPLSLPYDELQSMSHTAKIVTITCVVGWTIRALWEGIPLADLLALAAPSPEANTVIFHASDGYTTSLPLQTIVEKNLIIADRINGIVLPARNGFPFQLVAEDKWGYKWIKWLTRIELSNDPSYRGYWESRGYVNSADVGGPKFGP